MLARCVCAKLLLTRATSVGLFLSGAIHRGVGAESIIRRNWSDRTAGGSQEGYPGRRWRHPKDTFKLIGTAARAFDTGQATFTFSAISVKEALSVPATDP